MNRRSLEILIAAIVGSLLLWPLAVLFDRMNWPVFHSWGLIHGSVLLAWPCLFLLSLITIATIGGTIRTLWRSRIIAAFAGAATAITVLAAVVALEIVVADRVFPPHVSWDPVSLWRQSLGGKAFVSLAVGLPILIPPFLAGGAARYVYRRVSR
jgi:hypothetical protein